MDASNASAATVRPTVCSRAILCTTNDSTVGCYAVLSPGQQHHMKPFSSLTHHEHVEYYGPSHQPDFRVDVLERQQSAYWLRTISASHTTNILSVACLQRRLKA
jgi:hypothetical protein